MRRLLTALSILSLTITLACILLHLTAPRTWHWSTTPTHTRAIALRFDDRKLYLSWQPKTPYRPAWAGQVNRRGLRYTRWSDGLPNTTYKRGWSTDMEKWFCSFTCTTYRARWYMDER